MKRTITLMICSLLFTGLVAQQSKIENIRLKLSQGNDSLVVNYDLAGKRSAFDVKIDVKSEEGQSFYPRSIFGDAGTVIPGNNKTIFWDMKTDQADLSGKTLLIKVVGNVFVPEQVKKSVWIPWLYIAAGISAATGTYAHIRSNRMYEDYQIAAMTDEAENLYKDYERMLMLRNGAFGAAGGFGIAGVVVHVKHIQKKRALAISYLPVRDGAVVGLNINF